MKLSNIKNQSGCLAKNCLKAYCLGFLMLFSCEDFVKIDPPRTELVKETVFTSDATATAAMLDIYYQLQSSGFACGNESSITFLASISGDEQINYLISTPEATAQFQQFNDNKLTAGNSFVLSLWSGLYQCIYKSNAIIEGLATSSGVSDGYKRQLEGEAKFIRAFCHFYLVNLFGDVPLVNTTDYRANAGISRTPTAVVYQSIIDDLIRAQTLLKDDYSFSANQRVRVNKGAATALLARTYLFTEDWPNAEIQASAIIGNTALYNLSGSLSAVFSVNGTEAIFQLSSNVRPKERATFRFVDTPIFGALRPEFASGFEVGDSRRSVWVSQTPSGYYSSFKYTSSASNPPAQYSTVLRLAEQYLIRAEARAHLNNVSGAQADINVIRHRASLGDTPANDQASLIVAVEKERRYELFNEWGHRWFDLKRTNRINAVLSLVKPQWAGTAALYPIPEAQLLNDPAMKNAQNPGY